MKTTVENDADYNPHEGLKLDMTIMTKQHFLSRNASYMYNIPYAFMQMEAKGRY